MRLTNTTRETIDIAVKGEAKDGVPPTESLAPGETRNIAGVVETPQLQGLLHAGALAQVAPASGSRAKD